MTRNRKCHEVSNSFVATAEQVRLDEADVTGRSTPLHHSCRLVIFNNVTVVRFLCWPLEAVCSQAVCEIESMIVY